MTALTLLVLIGLIWATKELVLGAILWYQRRKIRHDLRVEITQRYFAEARNQLMELALRDEVDVNSATFAMLYNFNTAMMRRPDNYPEISARLRRALLTSDGNSPLTNSLDKERKLWTPGVKDVVLKTSDALNYIIINHSCLLRGIDKFRWLFRPTLSFVANRLEKLEKYIESRERKGSVVADVRAAQEAFNKLAATV